MRISNRLPHRVLVLILVQSILAFAVTLASSFSLIYFLRNGYSEIVGIAYLLGVFSVALIVASTIHQKLLSRPQVSMSVGLGALVFFYLTLWLAFSIYTIFIASMLYGIYISFFWIPFNSLMVCETSKFNRCTTIGTIGLSWPIINAFAPILGGLVIHHVGYFAIFIIAIFTISANIALIISTKAFDISFSVSKKIRSLYSQSFTFAIISQGVYDGILWTCTSLVAFFMLHDEVSVGAVLSFFAIVGAAMSLFLGLFSDKNGKREYYLQVGVVIALPFLISSAFSSNYMEFTLLISLMNIGLPLIGTFLTAMAVDKMETNKYDAIVLRERYLNLGRLIGGSMALTCAILGRLQFTFLLASPFMLYILFSAFERVKFVFSLSAFTKLQIRTR